jgi:hypothetical protein
VGLETIPPEGPAARGVSEVAPIESAASPPPEPQASSAASAFEPLKPAKADDLKAIKKAVDDSASLGGGLWLSYLFVLFYLAGVLS